MDIEGISKYFGDFYLLPIYFYFNFPKGRENFLNFKEISFRILHMVTFGRIWWAAVKIYVLLCALFCKCQFRLLNYVAQFFILIENFLSLSNIERNIKIFYSDYGLIYSFF